MSSTSDAVERTTAAIRSVAADPARLLSALSRWLTFSDYGAAAQRHLAVVWSCVLVCVAVDTVWLPNSKLSFASSNWTALLQGLGFCLLAGAFIVFASSRLRDDGTRAATILRATLHSVELLWRAALLISALLAAGCTLSYLITAADLPLQDALLARIDRDLGFHWLNFLDTTNSSPFLATFLTRVYQTSGPVALFVVVWLALNRRGERLAEFVAILSLSTIALCVTMWLVPAAGAFAYYRPAPQLFENLSTLGEPWSFFHTFRMLRDGSLSVIDLSALQGIVSFPSFHTMLGIITIHALRDTRWLMIPVLLVNGTMIVTTLPVGGHHLVDVLAGAALTFGAILLARRFDAGHRAAIL